MYFHKALREFIFLNINNYKPINPMNGNDVFTGHLGPKSKRELQRGAVTIQQQLVVSERVMS